MNTLSSVVAHAGTTHAGTPHAVLLVLLVAGVAAVAAGWRLVTGRRRGLGLAAFGAGLVVGLFGAIGLVEIQVTPAVAPAWTDVFPLLNVAVASLLAVGTLVVVRLRWPERLRYVALGLLLAGWIGYPAVFPADLTNPLGYAIVLGVPLAVAYILARDAGDALRRGLAARRARLTAVLTFAAFALFFAVSSGSLTFNPDPGGISGPILTFQPVAAPLVYWPALEFYAPAIPAAGYVSIGNLLLVALLGGLISLNAGLVVGRWTGAGAPESPRAMLGALASSGATACCCCAPALYGAVGAAFGTAASPVYWAFMDPASPAGGLFLAGAVVLLTASALDNAPAVGVPDGRQ